MQNFIKKGREHVNTGTLGEAAKACTIINAADMTVYDDNDNFKAVVLTDMYQAYSPGDEIPINTRVLYIKQGADAIVKIKASGSVSKGNEVTADSTALGEVSEDDDGQATIDKMGVAISDKDGNGFVWVDLKA